MYRVRKRKRGGGKETNTLERQIMIDVAKNGRIMTSMMIRHSNVLKFSPPAPPAMSPVGHRQPFPPPLSPPQNIEKGGGFGPLTNRIFPGTSPREVAQGEVCSRRHGADRDPAPPLDSPLPTQTHPRALRPSLVESLEPPRLGMGERRVAMATNPAARASWPVLIQECPC